MRLQPGDGSGDWSGQRAVSSLGGSEAHSPSLEGDTWGPVPKVDNALWFLPLPFTEGLGAVPAIWGGSGPWPPLG